MRKDRVLTQITCPSNILPCLTRRVMLDSLSLLTIESPESNIYYHIDLQMLPFEAFESLSSDSVYGLTL